ncbi:MAG: D-alanyl-D-alanine carboxypeptidase/D-alanyl-D-alanine-endopeptidase [Candidatus Saganbacteria bacterium]|nr:D-alanyl-D-alanine carboxypeptidase/D-alanyl-D-alanine-endopeptidase [Candidatus Saganbacteria bacterium]
MKKLRRSYFWPVLSGLILIFLALTAYFSLNNARWQIKLEPAVQRILSNSRYSHANWGLLAVDAKSGAILLELNPDKLFVPASTTKLFTCASALKVLGPDFRFKTPVYQHGKIDPRLGILWGDLILVANGDLTMGGRRRDNDTIAFTDLDHTDANALDGAELTAPNPLAGLDQLAAQVKASGISKVMGDIIIDTRLYPIARRPGGHFLSPISINDNLIDFSITPTGPGQPARVTWRPFTEFYDVDILVTTADKGQENRIFINESDSTIKVRGQISADTKELVKTYQVEDPAAFARALFMEALEQAGVSVNATLRKENPAWELPKKERYAEMKKVAELVSLPFSEYVKLILKVSHNAGADNLVCLIAAASGKWGFEAGLAAEKDILKQAGVDLDQVFLGDGEGGVREDLISPQAAVQLLRCMGREKSFAAYRHALPLLGVDGSLAAMAKENDPARGKVAAKTGTTIMLIPMNQTPFLLCKGLAGYIQAKKGREIAFAFYVNNVNMPEAKDLAAIGRFATDVGIDLGRIAQVLYLNN